MDTAHTVEKTEPGAVPPSTPDNRGQAAGPPESSPGSCDGELLDAGQILAAAFDHAPCGLCLTALSGRFCG